MRIYFRNKNAFLLQNHSRQNYVARPLCRRIYVAFIMHRGLYKCTGYAQIQVRYNAVENGNYSLYTQEMGNADEEGILQRQRDMKWTGELNIYIKK